MPLFLFECVHFADTYFIISFFLIVIVCHACQTCRLNFNVQQQLMKNISSSFQALVLLCSKLNLTVFESVLIHHYVSMHLSISQEIMFLRLHLFKGLFKSLILHIFSYNESVWCLLQLHWPIKRTSEKACNCSQYQTKEVSGFCCYTSQSNIIARCKFVKP